MNQCFIAKENRKTDARKIDTVSLFWPILWPVYCIFPSVRNNQRPYRPNANLESLVKEYRVT
jgi:hypothetical protein